MLIDLLVRVRRKCGRLVWDVGLMECLMYNKEELFT